MRRDAPPYWMERMLALLLPIAQRESVTGDLLEEYRQEQLPRAGVAGADSWYLRQLMSFMLVRLAGGLWMKGVLASLCAFHIAAAAWLAVMEQLLRHDGYRGRTWIASAIALQAFATLAVVARKRGVPLRVLVEIGAVAIVVLGASAIYRNSTATHFEGFALIIGTALVVQGSTTLLTLLPQRLYEPTR